MARKVFISFLGAIPYESTQYYMGNTENASSPTPYVQVAIFEKYLLDIWQQNDKIYFFTTDDAYKNNYIDRITKFDFTAMRAVLSPERDGLNSRFETMKNAGKITHYEHIRIENGNTVDEIWKVFQSVYEKLEKLPEKTELYFDITYGFRSLPMLGIVLLNYAKALSNIDIKYIFYGNFEVGKQDRDNTVKQLMKQGADEAAISEAKKSTPLSPILDLRPFVELQEWTTAARSFLNGGNTQLLKNLIAPEHPKVAEHLDTFATSLLMCRGQQLNRDFDVDTFKNEIVALQTQTISVQLAPLLEKIEEKMQPFNSKNTLNGIHAVEWCINNGLVQQGYTFLQETLKSYLIEKVFHDSNLLEDYLIDYKIRSIASSALDGATKSALKKKILKDGENDDKYKGLLTKADHYAYELHTHIKNLHIAQYYTQLTGKGRGLRNDINHCGFQKNYASSSDLIEELKDLLKNIKKILNV